MSTVANDLMRSHTGRRHGLMDGLYWPIDCVCRSQVWPIQTLLYPKAIKGTVCYGKPASVSSLQIQAVRKESILAFR